MQPIEAPKTNPAAGVVPAPQPGAPWRVAAVEPLPQLRLHVTFADGTLGEVWLGSLLESPKVTGTIFEPLRDPEFFRRVRVELGAVTWPNGADLAPDAMYDAIRAHGRWTVDD
jgi:hypothetical protein